MFKKKPFNLQTKNINERKKRIPKLNTRSSNIPQINILKKSLLPGDLKKKLNQKNKNSMNSNNKMNENLIKSLKKKKPKEKKGKILKNLKNQRIYTEQFAKELVNTFLDQHILKSTLDVYKEEINKSNTIMYCIVSFCSLILQQSPHGSALSPPPKGPTPGSGEAARRACPRRHPKIKK